MDSESIGEGNRRSMCKKYVLERCDDGTTTTVEELGTAQPYFYLPMRVLARNLSCHIFAYVFG